LDKAEVEDDLIEVVNHHLVMDPEALITGLQEDLLLVLLLILVPLLPGQVVPMVQDSLMEDLLVLLTLDTPCSFYLWIN
jgi:hypothetical protein